MKTLSALTLASALALSACSSSTTEHGVVQADGVAVDHPSWVMRGNASADGALYGVGSATGIRNPTLLKSTAENRARAEISRTMEVYVAALMKDYMASTSAGDANVTSEEQHVESAIKSFSANTLNGVQIDDHWIHPVDGTMYALARLNLNGFVDQIQKSKELNAAVKAAVKQSAEKAMTDLSVEEAKHADE